MLKIVHTLRYIKFKFKDEILIEYIKSRKWY